jgi:stearoyl-CoA desaturase (delta-9 desaturase)
VNLDGAGISYDAAHCEMSKGVSSGEVWSGGIDWPVVVWIVLVHALALVAPFFFSWQAVLVCAMLMIMTGAMGVCMGYHRCLTHGSFKTYRPVRWLLAFLGGLSGEGSALTAAGPAG